VTSGESSGLASEDASMRADAGASAQPMARLHVPSAAQKRSGGYRTRWK
jgi:hypothetical protein